MLSAGPLRALTNSGLSRELELEWKSTETTERQLEESMRRSVGSHPGNRK